MKYLIHSILLITVSTYIYGLSSCTTPKQNQLTTTSSDSLRTFVLKYERGPCFGQCPVYAFYLLSDHTAIVNAKANLMDTAGWYYSTPDQEAIVEILELLEPMEWWMVDLKDQPEIADLPQVSLNYHHPKGIRRMTIQSRTTHSLETVFVKLNHIVTESLWVKTDMRPYEIPEPARTDLIVQLKEGVDIHEWMKKFDSFGIQLKKRLSPRGQYYLVSKHPEKGYSNDFLQSIKLDPDVVDAQWDNQLQRRD